jgi:hypothetical protein
MQMKKLLRKIGSIFSSIVFPKLFIVASRPFTDQGKWKILYGTPTSYRCLEFSTVDAADHEFESIRRFVAYGYGETIAGFVIVCEQQTLSVLRGTPYADVIKQAMLARDVERTHEKIDLMSEAV